MPVAVSYPGVYVEEIPSGVRTIVGVATSITAFVGSAARGPTNEATVINSFGDYEKIFGGLWLKSSMSFAVRDFFLNGGSRAVIVRLFHKESASADELKQIKEIAQTVADAATNAADLAAAKSAAENAFNDATAKAKATGAMKSAAQTVLDAIRNLSVPVQQQGKETAKTAGEGPAAKTGGAAAAPKTSAAVTAARKVADAVSAPDLASAKSEAENALNDFKGKSGAELHAAQQVVKALNALPPHAGAEEITKALDDAVEKVAATEDESASSDSSSGGGLGAGSNPPDQKGMTASAAKDAVTAAVTAAAADSMAKITVGPFDFTAAYDGKWGANLRIRIDTDNIGSDVAQSMKLGQGDLFNLTVTDTSPGGATERYLNLTVKESPRRVDKVLADQSSLITCPELPAAPSAMAAASDLLTQLEEVVKASEDALLQAQISGKADTSAEKAALKDARVKLASAETLVASGIQAGVPLALSDFLPDQGEAKKHGIYALEQVFARDGLFNILCIPPFDYQSLPDLPPPLVAQAASYCEKRRAMLLVDAPSGWNNAKDAVNGFSDPDTDNVGTRSKNAALFFPRLKQANPLRDNQLEEFVPCGSVAGIFARTDAERGVWKAPAGIDASLVGVSMLSVHLIDAEQGELNPLGINCLRSFPIYGKVVWGARTLRGADQFADEYKYIPVRRTALFIEESLFRGLKWVVFEPNDEPLWAQIRLNVGAFMHNLFRQGAFQGQTPKDAYFVKCDKESTTQTDINLGIVNVVVGFAPLKPAEFVVIKLQQMAGQIEV